MTNYPKRNGNFYDPNEYINDDQNSIKIKTIPNTSIEVGYEWGQKDPWAVYVKINKSRRPRDKDYFRYLKELSDTYGIKSVMKDFLNIYNKATSKLDYKVLNDDIDQISDKYCKSVRDSINVNYLFTILYLAMIAEFHYVTKNGYPSKVNKKVKLIGVWHVLFDNRTPEEAAQWSKFKSPKDEIIPEYNRAIESLRNLSFKI